MAGVPLAGSSLDLARWCPRSESWRAPNARCFEVDGLEPDEVVRRLLGRRIITNASPYRVSYARLAPSVVNTTEEVDSVLRAVRAISAT